MIRQEEARLRAVFRSVLAVALAAPLPLALQHCRADPGAPEEHGDASDEAPVFDDPMMRFDAADPCLPKTYVPGPEVDASDVCGDLVSLHCGLPAGTVPRECFFSIDDCAAFCGPFLFECHAYGDSCVDAAVVPREAGVVVDCVRCPNGSGRRPAGLAPPSFVSGTSAVGDYFARAAHLEAASVIAFRGLRDELASLGAPPSLVNAAARSMREEARHMRLTAKLARRHGAMPPHARATRPARRSLEALALENAAEGCVRETFGALVVTWQATHAKDPEIAAVMSRIAEDETRHAALAWAVSRWAASRLGLAARERVAEAARDAIANLASETFGADPAPELTAAAGVPTSATLQSLLRGLARSLPLTARRRERRAPDRGASRCS